MSTAKLGILIGGLVGVVVAALAVAIIALIGESHLTKENSERLAVRQINLCKFKVFDEAIGENALRIRGKRNTPGYEPAYAALLRSELLPLIRSVKSAERCPLTPVAARSTRRAARKTATVQSATTPAAARALEVANSAPGHTPAPGSPRTTPKTRHGSHGGGGQGGTGGSGGSGGSPGAPAGPTPATPPEGVATPAAVTPEPPASTTTTTAPSEPSKPTEPPASTTPGEPPVRVHGKLCVELLVVTVGC